MGAIDSVAYKAVSFALSSGVSSNHLGRILVQRAVVSRSSARENLKVVDGNDWRAVDLTGESLTFSGYIVDPADVVGVLERGLLVDASSDTYDITVGGRQYKNCSCTRAKVSVKIEDGVNVLEGALKFHRTLRDEVPAYSSGRWLWRSINGLSMEEVVSSSVVKGGRLLLADVLYTKWRWSCERYQICLPNLGAIRDALPDGLESQKKLEAHVALPDGSVAGLKVPSGWPSSSIDYDKKWYKTKTLLKLHNDRGVAALSERWEARLPADASDVEFADFAVDDEKPLDKATESEAECK